MNEVTELQIGRGDTDTDFFADIPQRPLDDGLAVLEVPAGRSEETTGIHVPGTAEQQHAAVGAVQQDHHVDHAPLADPVAHAGLSARGAAKAWDGWVSNSKGTLVSLVWQMRR